ncbi:MAG TPA: VOC family protein [Caulobacteraceae bacterium]|nr:VOC family protein [Caulobacteraceae bacterium]
MKIQAVDHVQIAMPAGGEDQARAFYGVLLGLREKPKPPVLAVRGGCWFQGAGAEIHLGVDPDFRPARKAHVAFKVDEIGSFRERARNAGYEVREDDDIEGVDRVFVFDPFGNRLEFVRPEAPGFSRA